MIDIAALNTLDAAHFAQQLEPLFESAPPLVRALYAERPFASYRELIDRAEALTRTLPPGEQVEVVNAHPRIGDSAAHMSAISAREQSAAHVDSSPGTREQRAAHVDPAVDAELAQLNAAYEQRFGFRFVVFVNKRPREVIRDVLRRRLSGEPAAELETAQREMFAIARDRLKTLELR